MSRLLFLSVFFAASMAEARTVHVKSCVMTIGRFCPVESVGAVLFAVCLFAFAGFPVRWAIRKHIAARLAADPNYQPTGGTLFLYRYAGYAVLGIVGLVLTLALASR